MDGSASERSAAVLQQRPILHTAPQQQHAGLTRHRDRPLHRSSDDGRHRVGTLRGQLGTAHDRMLAADAQADRTKQRRAQPPARSSTFEASDASMRSIMEEEEERSWAKTAAAAAAAAAAASEGGTPAFKLRRVASGGSARGGGQAAAAQAAQAAELSAIFARRESGMGIGDTKGRARDIRSLKRRSTSPDRGPEKN